MKKINLFPIYLVVLLLAFTSCNSENDVMDANLKTDTETEYNSETAFAIHFNDDRAYCFLDEGFDRWGWTMGPITEEFNWFRLYAGAGQCELDKGEHIGRVEIWYNAAENSAKVKYYLRSDKGYGLNETHLYIGSNKFPLNNKGKETVAPGQYPYKHSDLGGVKTDVYIIENVPDGFYLIAHAVVSK